MKGQRKDSAHEGIILLKQEKSPSRQLSLGIWRSATSILDLMWGGIPRKSVCELNKMKLRPSFCGKSFAFSIVSFIGATFFLREDIGRTPLICGSSFSSILSSCSNAPDCESLPWHLEKLREEGASSRLLENDFRISAGCDSNFGSIICISWE